MSFHGDLGHSNSELATSYARIRQSNIGTAISNRINYDNTRQIFPTAPLIYRQNIDDGSELKMTLLLINTCGEPDQSQVFEYYDSLTTVAQVKEHISELTWYPVQYIQIYTNQRQLLLDEFNVQGHVTDDVLFYDTRHWIPFCRKNVSKGDGVVSIICKTTEDDIDDLHYVTTKTGHPRHPTSPFYHFVTSNM